MSDPAATLPDPGPAPAATAADYLRLAQDLGPRGWAWPREPGAVQTQYWAAVAEEWGRLHGRTLDLVEREALPVAAWECLVDWERVCGLPDACTGAAATLLDERRAVVGARLAARGGQSIAFITALAQSLGYAVAIEEYRPFRCGLGLCGEDLLWATPDDAAGPAAVAHYWRVAVLEPRAVWFRCGESLCGEDRLSDFRLGEDLECVLRRAAPAHTYLIVAYQGS